MTNKTKTVAKKATQPKLSSVSKQMKNMRINTSGRPGPSSSVSKLQKFFPKGVPSMSRKCVTVDEDEYITDISSTTSFTNTQFALNPGQSGTFPWLYKIAANWEKYKFNKIEFYYKPEASAYATAGQTGKVILSFDYDAADAAPTSKTMCEDTDPHVDCMPYEECYLPLDVAFINDTLTGKYVRPGGVPGATDIRLYDGGNLNVSTYGTTTGGVCGEIRVRYSVTFEKPILEPAATISNNYSVAHFQSTTTEVAGATTVGTTLLLATSVVNGLGIVNTSGSFSLPFGNYLVIARNAITFTAANQILGYNLDVQRNGVTTVPAGSLYGMNTSAQLSIGTPLNTGDISFFLQSTTAANAYTLVSTLTYNEGAATNAGQLIFISI